MIVDSHVYAFSRPDVPPVGPRTAIRMRAMQRMHASHHQSAWHTDDRTTVDASAIGGRTVGTYRSRPSTSGWMLSTGGWPGPRTGAR